MRSPAVREIPESDATGQVATLYTDIRRVLGVPYVPLIYRALAVEPARLQSVWGDLAPNLCARVVREAASTLVPRPLQLPAAERPRLHEVRDLVDLDEARRTLDAFGHANALSLVGLLALLEGVDASSPYRAAPDVAPVVRRLLPLAPLERISAPAFARLERVSAAVTGGQAPTLIPTLFRHFASDEAVLTFVLACVEPYLDSPSFIEGAQSLRSEAARIAAALPFRVTALDGQGTRDLVMRFVRTIPAMIVCGSILQAAFRDEDEDLRRR